MLPIREYKDFKKSFKRILKHKHFKKENFYFVLDQLRQRKILDRKYKDHQLAGNYFGYRECHLQNDILLIYFYDNEEIVLVLVNIGSHSELM